MHTVGDGSAKTTFFGYTSLNNASDYPTNGL